jgi:hypothetical protein
MSNVAIDHYFFSTRTSRTPFDSGDSMFSILNGLSFLNFSFGDLLPITDFLNILETLNVGS